MRRPSRSTIYIHAHISWPVAVTLSTHTHKHTRHTYRARGATTLWIIPLALLPHSQRRHKYAKRKIRYKPHVEKNTHTQLYARRMRYPVTGHRRLGANRKSCDRIVFKIQDRSANISVRQNIGPERHTLEKKNVHTSTHTPKTPALYSSTIALRLRLRLLLLLV